MSPTSAATVPATTRCCSARRNTSLMATFGGAFSLACLISAIMTDMWTYTEEGISPPGLSRAAKKQNFDASIPESSAAVTSPGEPKFQGHSTTVQRREILFKL